jgi:hypothetical protein
MCQIKSLIQALPKPHYDILECIILHLHKISQYSEKNKMETMNLAIVFGPGILRMPVGDPTDLKSAYGDMLNMGFQNSFVEACLIQANWLFDGSLE